jgi:gamma-glutamylputrescine oxidase
VLLELVIENYAVVDRLRVRFHPGLNLLTGETGSGKSIVVDALGLLFGGRVSYSGLDAMNTKRATRKRMLKVFPQLADAAVEYAWGGYVDITMNRAPDFGRLAPHIYYLQGFSGHGIALTGVAGKLVAEAIAGQAERFDLFTKIEHRNFPGGPLLRTPALMLAMLWYRMRDWL